MQYQAQELACALRGMAKVLGTEVVLGVPTDEFWVSTMTMTIDGAARGYTGLNRRPIFAGGAATEQVLRGMARERTAANPNKILNMEKNAKRRQRKKAGGQERREKEKREEERGGEEKGKRREGKE
eukprot:gene11744-22174_t